VEVGEGLAAGEDLGLGEGLVVFVCVELGEGVGVGDEIDPGVEEDDRLAESLFGYDLFALTPIKTRKNSSYADYKIPFISHL